MNMKITDVDTDGLSDVVLQSLDYNKETGDVVWRSRGVGRRKNKCAGYKRKDGYIDIDISINGSVSRLKAHRVAWFLHHGYWPKNVIDHINGNRHDNRIENLRDVSHQENIQNISLISKRSRTGHIGVIDKGDGAFMALIEVDGREIHLGTFDSIKEAIASYVTAKKLIHKGFVAVR